MRFGSVCSGIEAASVAWNPLGWKAAWLSEIEPFPSAVLAHHYPNAPNLGDMTTLPERILSGEVEAPDLLCGGTPCQAFSVAGLRNSLDDARGNLSLTFVGIANAIDTRRTNDGLVPGVIFWENVPGVLSTKDNAFGCFLAGLAGEVDTLEPPGGRWANAGYVLGPQRAVAWRVLDAQYFGVAQRRRRVFVVASARDDFDPAAVLFEFNGLRRDIAPSREAGKETPTGAGASTESGSGVITMAHGQGGAEIGFDRGPTLTCNHEAPIAAYALQHAQIGRKDSAGPQGKGWQADVAFTQDSRSCADAVAIVPTQPIAFHPTQDPISSEDGTTHAMGCGSSGGQASVAVAQPIGLDEEQNAMIDGFGTLKARTAGGGFEGSVMQTNMQVRRLTPVECERLQGFPDNYTNIPWRKKPESPDGPRYKALGNSWAVPVVRWIGKRIQEELNGAD